jgi:hypothetical protein
VSAAPLREQLQIARINRAKRRVHEWWHRERCEACRVQRTAQADLGAAVSALVLRARDELGEGLSAPPPTDAPKH